MIQHVWEVGTRSSAVRRVVVATDCEEIAGVVRGFGGEAVLTGREFPSGSDRVAWVAERLGTEDGEIVVNLQGDEPLLSPSALDRLVGALAEDPTADIATLVVACAGEAVRDPNVVKAAVSREGRALFFSRQPLGLENDRFLKHIGVYAYRFGSLKRFCAAEPSPWERAERLEQLRALEAGMSIRAVEISHDTIAVDVPEDVPRVEQRLRESFGGFAERGHR